MKLFKVLCQLALVALGAFLFMRALGGVNPSRLLPLVPALSGPWALILLFYPVASIWDAMAWKRVFPAAWRSRLPLGEAYWIRIAGEAVNNVTPFVDVGGEPLKVWLLERRFGVPRETGIAAGVIDRTSLLFSELIFIAAGLALSVLWLPTIPSEWRAGFALAAAGMALAVAGLIFAERRGLLVTWLGWLAFFHIRPRLSPRVERSFRRFDESLRRFYKTERPALFASFSLHLVGWAMGSIEMWLMFQALGSPIGLRESFVLEALLQLVRVASFMIPGNLGAQEMGLAFFAPLAGADAGIGVAVSLFKRVRQVAWSLAGVGIWAAYGLLGIRVRDAFDVEG